MTFFSLLTVLTDVTRWCVTWLSATSSIVNCQNKRFVTYILTCLRVEPLNVLNFVIVICDKGLNDTSKSYRCYIFQLCKKIPPPHLVLSSPLSLLPLFMKTHKYKHIHSTNSYFLKDNLWFLTHWNIAQSQKNINTKKLYISYCLGHSLLQRNVTVTETLIFWKEMLPSKNLEDCSSMFAYNEETLLAFSLL